jgi:hypothetical protein
MMVYFNRNSDPKQDATRESQLDSPMRKANSRNHRGHRDNRGNLTSNTAGSDKKLNTYI